MKTWLIVAAALFVPGAAYAQGPKACEELKSEIAAKLEAKGVKSYSLEIVDKDKEAEGKVVGACGGGTKRIVYSKTATPAQTPPAAPTKP